MAPANIRKEGSAYDLPLAIGIMASAKMVSEEKLSQYVIMGELGLDGSLQPIKGHFLLQLQPVLKILKDLSYQNKMHVKRQLLIN